MPVPEGPTPFIDDLLISYSRADDIPVLKGEAGWVSDFHRKLLIRIQTHLGWEPQIWRDTRLEGQVIRKEILERLRSAAALVAILSPNFLTSDWCPWELEEFCKAARANGGLERGPLNRLFKVLKLPVEKEPPDLAERRHYKFYEDIKESGRIREISPTFDFEVEHLNRIDELAQDITKFLKAVDEKGWPPPDEPTDDEPAESVYLAQTSWDLQAVRPIVQRDLKGYRVLPDQDLRLVGPPHLEEVIREQLSRCTLSIHMMGRSYGDIPDGHEQSIVALQHRLAAERDGFPRLVWIPPGIEVVDPRQKRFLEELRSATDFRVPSDLLEVPFADLKKTIHDKLSAVKEPPPGPDAEGARIFLLTDARDVDASSANAMANYLHGRGYDVILPASKGSKVKINRDRQENIRSCDAILLFYGDCEELWLRRMMGEIRGSLETRRTPLRSYAIYVAQPESAEKQRLRFHRPPVIREPTEGFSPRLLEEFVARLEQGRMRRTR
jgi:hypothetical protein